MEGDIPLAVSHRSSPLGRHACTLEVSEVIAGNCQYDQGQRSFPTFLRTAALGFSAFPLGEYLVIQCLSHRKGHRKTWRWRSSREFYIMIHRQAGTKREKGVAAWALEISMHITSDILPTPPRPHLLIPLNLSTSCTIWLPSIQIQKPIGGRSFQTTSLDHIFFFTGKKNCRPSPLTHMPAGRFLQSGNSRSKASAEL